MLLLLLFVAVAVSRRRHRRDYRRRFLVLLFHRVVSPFHDHPALHCARFVAFPLRRVGFKDCAHAFNSKRLFFLVSICFQRIFSGRGDSFDRRHRARTSRWNRGGNVLRPRGKFCGEDNGTYVFASRAGSACGCPFSPPAYPPA